MKASNRYYLWKAKHNKNPSEFQNVYNTDQLEAMCNVRLAWSRVTQETIRNCFLHTGLIGDANDVDMMATDMTELVDEETLEYIQEMHPDIRAENINITNENEDGMVRCDERLVQQGKWFH
jgi:hypothetical protein